MTAKPPDRPQFIVRPNAFRPGLVTFSVGTARDPLNIAPELAEHLADDLLAAAAAARRAGGEA